MKKISLLVIALASTSVFALGTVGGHPYETQKTPATTLEEKKETKNVVTEVKAATEEAKKATENKVAEKAKSAEQPKNEALNYL